MTTNYFLEEVDETRGDLYEGHDYEPTPFEKEADLFYMHHSDGGITEVLHTKADEDKRNELIFVMVPGFITILDSWERFLHGIKPYFDIYYWESREKGTFHPPSDLKRKHFTPERFVKDLVEFLDAANLGEKEYLLCGSSFGGTIMIDAMAEKKVIPHTAFLIGANTHFHIPFPGNILVKILPAKVITLFKPAIRWYLRNFAVDLETDEKQYRKYVKAIELANFKYIKHTVINYHVHPQEEILSNITVETVVVGAKLDKMHTSEESKMTADEIPNSELVLFETNDDTHSQKFSDYIIERFG